jgi:hypothetical protein
MSIVKLLENREELKEVKSSIVPEKYKEALALAFALIPQLDWKNGKKVKECRDYASKFILDSLSKAEQIEILEYIYPVENII